MYFDRAYRGRKKPMLQAEERRKEPIRPGSLLQLEGVMFENFLHIFFNELIE